MPSLAVTQSSRKEGPASLYLFYTPVLVSLSLNLALFLSIVVSLAVTRHQTREARTSVRQVVKVKVSNKPFFVYPTRSQTGHQGRVNKDTREQLLLYTKLFLLLGILWICEVLHKFLHREDADHEAGAEVLFRIGTVHQYLKQ